MVFRVGQSEGAWGDGGGTIPRPSEEQAHPHASLMDKKKSIVQSMSVIDVKLKDDTALCPGHTYPSTAWWPLTHNYWNK